MSLMLVIQNVLAVLVLLDKEDIMDYDSFKENPEVVKFDKKWKELISKIGNDFKEDADVVLVTSNEKKYKMQPTNRKLVRVENSSFNEE